MAIRREEKALMEFKHIMEDVVHLLRKSVNAETVYFYWVNRAREQFVLETTSTKLPNVMFQDRISIDQFYLRDYQDLKQTVTLKAGMDVPHDELKHYYDFVPIHYITLIPFINNGETVSITVIESEKKPDTAALEETFSAYRNALVNVLNTYLELTDLYESQKEWADYEASLDRLAPRHHKVDILDTMLNEMQKLLPNGGTTLLLRGMDTWTTVLSTTPPDKGLMAGLEMEEKSMAYDALQKGEPQFSIHFNQNPKRVSSSERKTDGASLAIPILINDRRHGVVIAWDKSPLVFKESVKHQLINLVRMATLTMQVNLGKLPVHQDLATTEYGNFIPDLWEKTINNEIEHLTDESIQVSFGLITIDNLTELRSKYRLEDLKKLQRILVRVLNPSRLGFNGFIGFNSDYVFTCMLYTESSDEVEEWFGGINETLKEPVDLGDNRSVKVDIKFGYTRLNSTDEDAHMVLNKAKKALSGVINISA